jgi:tRNA (guanine-N7-)-methyltransferase
VSEFLPKVAVDLSKGSVSTETLFAFGPKEVRLEIGFGDGERLIEQATLGLDIGFIGCEPFVNGVAKALAGIADRALGNVRIHCGDARDLVSALPDASLDGIELLYPDPWPKRRHRKRRIVSDEFLSSIASKLRTGATFRFATDIDDYCGWTLARILRSPDLEWTATRPQDWLEPWSGWKTTRYEEKARAEGRKSAYLTFVKK